MELPRGAPFPGFVEGASVAEPSDLLGVFRPEDAQLRWRLDFHYPRGIVPLGHELLAVVNRSSQEAAESVPVPTGRGLVSRLVGPHVYTTGLPVLDADEVAQRAAASSAEIASYPDRFLALWRQEAAAQEEAFRSLRRRIGAAHDLPTLGRRFEEANVLFARAWRTHFDVMYRLLGVLQSFRTVCAAVGIPDEDVPQLLASGDTSVQRTDQGLWLLSTAARDAGLTPVFEAHTGRELLTVLRSQDGVGSWWAGFERFVDAMGDRGDAVTDVTDPSWREAPERPLGLVRQMLLGGRNPDLLAAVQAARRADRLAALRAAMGPRDRDTFDRARAWCLRANFSWWNEEHNTHIDLRAHLPVRAVGRAVAQAAGGARDDGLMLYAGEVRALTAGQLSWSDVADIVQQREAHHRSWLQRRADLPRAVGTATGAADPLMAEIIGVDHVLAGVVTPALLRGLPASPGIARGPVRLVSDVSQLDRVEPGDVLVCEATSPSWTPIFPRLAACLCDSGGPLTHAAIVCREYGLPSVCALGVAMQTLHDGDLVEVDGRAGTVTVLRRASGP